MQTIAPDFYVPLDGTSQAYAQERPRDGLFGALLRDEEARYERDSQATRNDSEASRPARDDFGREEARRDERVREEPAERPESHADDRDVVREARSPQDEDRLDPGSDDQPASSQEADFIGEASVAGGGDTAASAAEARTDNTGKQADAGPINGPASVQQAPTAFATVLTGNDAKTADPSAAAGKADAKVSGTATSALAATAQSTVATPGASDRKSPAQPTKEAAAPQPAADKASSTASATAPNQMNAANRQSPNVPLEAPVENGKRPAGRTAGTARAADPATVQPASDSLSSRPSAALGGGAATAALAQPAKPVATEKTTNSPKTQSGLQEAGDKATPQSQQQSNAAAATTAAASGKTARASLATAPAGGDAAGTSAGSTSAPNSIPLGGAALSSGGVQSSSFAEAMANARPGTSASPAEQIAVQVRSAQVAGKEQINIKLHPAELGRIEVKLESGSDGTIRASISAERADTLDLLQRDARGLERALQDAGVKTDSGSLSFNLRGQGQEQQAEGDDASGRAATDDNTLAADSGDPAAAEHQQRQASHDGALDIRV